MPSNRGFRIGLLIVLGGMASSAPAETLNVVSFNIRGATLGFDPVDSWLWLNVNNPDPLAGPHRRDRALAIIDTMAPDLMGVEELKFNQRNDILAAFPEYSYYGQGRDGGEDNGDSNGVFYRADRFRLLDAGDFWLSSTPTVPGTTFVGNGSDTGNPRMATWVILRDLATAQRYFVLNTHWSLDSLARTQSGTLIQSQLDELSQGLPILLLGDLNTSSSSTAYRTLRGLTGTPDVVLADAFADAGGIDGRTFHAYSGGVSGSRIDHILYSGDPFTPISATIWRNTYDGGLYPSDHYPVSTLFTVAVPELSASLMAGGSLLVGSVILLSRRRHSR